MVKRIYGSAGDATGDYDSGVRTLIHLRLQGLRNFDKKRRTPEPWAKYPLPFHYRIPGPLGPDLYSEKLTRAPFHPFQRC